MERERDWEVERGGAKDGLAKVVEKMVVVVGKMMTVMAMKIIPRIFRFKMIRPPPGRGWLIEGWQQMPWYPPGVTNIW